MSEQNNTSGSEVDREQAEIDLEVARDEARRFGLERLIFFSDAVFAIAITLLALEMRLPDEIQDLSNLGLAQAILAMWPEFLAFAISFFVIGQNWIGHHRRFSYIRRFDRTLTSLNLILLFLVVLMPFPTSVLSETVNTTSVVFYALFVVLIVAVTLAMWEYASRDRRLLQPFVTDDADKRERIVLLYTIAVFGASIIVALFWPEVAMLSWLLLLGTNWVAGRRVRIL